MSRPPLNAFGALLGLWVGLVTVALLAVARLDSSAMLAGGVFVALTVWLFARRTDLVGTFARRRLHYWLVWLPIVVGVVAAVLDVVGGADLGVPEDGPATDPLVGLVFGIGILLAIVGAVAFVVADNRYAAQRRDAERELLAWSAPMDESYHGTVRNWYLVAAVVLSVAGLVGIGVGVPMAGGLLSGGIATGLLAVTTLDRTVDYTALEGGVVVGANSAIREQYVPWGRFIGYERTDEALVLERWLPGTSMHVATAALDDPNEVARVVADRIG